MQHNKLSAKRYRKLRSWLQQSGNETQYHNRYNQLVHRYWSMYILDVVWADWMVSNFEALARVLRRFSETTFHNQKRQSNWVGK